MKKYRAWIINNATGEGRWSDHEVEDQYADNQEFMWTDGNYGCDCNRHLLWHRAAGVEPLDGDCGHEAYSVPYIEWEGGQRERIDDPPTGNTGE